MRIAAYSALCIALVLTIVIVGASLAPSSELPMLQKPMWRLAQNLLTVSLVGAIGGALAAVIMDLIVDGQVPSKSYIHPTVCTFWGIALVLVAWKFTSPTSFSTGIVQILIQTAAITLGLYLGTGLNVRRRRNR